MKHLITLLALPLAACSLGLQSPEIILPERYIYADTLPRAEHLTSQWWHIFEDERLDSLIEYSLLHNRNLQMAASRIVEAHHNISTARATLLPSFTAVVQAEGSRTPPRSSAGEFFLEPSIAWRTSLFGALRYTSQQTKAEYLATEWAYRALTLTLTHEVTSAYFTLITSQQLLLLAQQSLELRTESQSLIDSLARYGFASGLDSAQAQSLKDEAAADVEQYRRATNVAQLSLSTLTGSLPDHAPMQTLPLPSLPEAIPAGIPSQLLTHRPDLIEAHYQLQAAAAAVGIARSDRFPGISLTGSGGLFGENVREIFTQGQWAWSATGAVAQPIFAFGKLRRQEHIAREQYRQSALQYEQAILQALEEVEQALTTTATLNAQARHYARYVERNATIASLQQALYRGGMSNYLDVISTEQTWYASQQQYVQVLMQQYQSIADLVLALGDGWQQ